MPSRLRKEARSLQRAVNGAWLVTGLSAASSALAGCSSNDAKTVRVTITPEKSNVLTCGTQSFSAKVTSTPSNSVSWSVSPDLGYGSIDDTGTYVAPRGTPTPATVSIDATSTDEPLAKSSASVTLGTAFPSAGKKLPEAPGMAALGGTGTYAHVIAARGTRLYAAWPDNRDASKALLKVARSDDAGATWQPAVTAISAAVLDDSAGAAGGLECPALAIDAGNADVIYATGHVVAENEYSKPLDDSTSGAQTELIAVSSDGGATWTTNVLHVGAGGDVCADVVSPAPSTVVVTSPGWADCTPDGNDARDIFVWSDSNQGAGFSGGSYTDAPVEYFADGYVDSLHDLAGDGCTRAHLWPRSDGGGDGAGDATESPRLFTDGAGKLCITYVGDVFPKKGSTVTSVYAQCSSDAGQSFSAPQELADAPLPGATSATGAFAPDGGAAITYSTAGNPDHKLFVSFSADGRTFGPPATVPTYFELNDDTSAALNPSLAYDATGVLWLSYRTLASGSLIVDKTCDAGPTFSGAVAVTNGSSLLKWPTFAPIDAPAPLLFAWGSDAITSFTLAPE